MNRTVTLTFGDVCENHAGMEKIGTKSKSGYSPEELQTFYNNFSTISECELVDLRCLLEDKLNITLPEVLVLVVRNPFPDLIDDLETVMFADEEQIQGNRILGVKWDRQKIMRGKIVNSHARYNLCFAKMRAPKRSACLEEGKGTLYNIDDIPALQELHNRIKNLTSNNDDLKCEGNYYYDTETTYIGFHGDRERSKTIGYRIGADFDLHFQWFYSQIPVSSPASVTLHRGDLYIMSELATGTKTIGTANGRLTLKHAAGKYEIVKK